MIKGSLEQDQFGFSEHLNIDQILRVCQPRSQGPMKDGVRVKRWPKAGILFCSAGANQHGLCRIPLRHTTKQESEEPHKQISLKAAKTLYADAWEVTAALTHSLSHKAQRTNLAYSLAVLIVPPGPGADVKRDKRASERFESAVTAWGIIYLKARRKMCWYCFVSFFVVDMHVNQEHPAWRGTKR